eukprot:3519463-Amphidinium_carterae.2
MRARLLPKSQPKYSDMIRHKGASGPSSYAGPVPANGVQVRKTLSQNGYGLSYQQSLDVY